MVEMMLGGAKGRKMNLLQSETMVAVRTATRGPMHRASMAASTRSALRSVETPLSFEGEDISILEHNQLGSNALKSALKGEDQFEFAGSVLKLEGTNEPIAYTERLFVALNEDASSETVKETLKALGENWRILRRLTYGAYCYLIAPRKRVGQEVFDRSMELVERIEVMRCHPEFLRQRAHKAVFKPQWHLGKRLIDGELIDQGANVDPAWSITRGEGTTIAVIDDGVDVSHPEFDRPGKIVAPFDFTNRVPDASPKYIPNNHGTACAGVACAAGVDGASGVAPEARLMPIRLRSGLGSIDESDAIMWAVSNGADVISNSWGPKDGNWSRPEDPQHDVHSPITDNSAMAIEAALNQGRLGKGCVVCWAAGNGNESVDLDGWASFPGVTAVAACNDRGTRSVYSDMGDAIACAFPSNDFEFGGLPAPRTPGIWTTDRTGRSGYDKRPSPMGDYTDSFGGTSSACPGAAGTAALVISANPMLKGAEVRDIIMDTAQKIDTAGGDYDANGHSKLYGKGRVDAEAAVYEALKR